MLFTSIGALPGLILVEWNVQAETQGSVGIWDAHFRFGGAYGTDLQVAQCPSSEPIQSGYIAASMMLHITPSSNGYFENMWAWVADHDIDDPANTQITVVAARGIPIESDTGPTWLYGTASEHSILYQYNFANTTNTFAGMIQTESPYYQYTTATESPGPFSSSIGLFANDPAFPDSTCDASALLCDFSWAFMLAENVNLTIAGAGLYSWFNNYIETCVDSQNCQQRLINDAGDNEALYLWNLVTIGAVEMVSNNYTGNAVLAKNNTQSIGHPYWGALAGYLDDYEPEIRSCAWNDTGPGCDETLLCDLTLTFETFADLQAAQGTFFGPMHRLLRNRYSLYCVECHHGQLYDCRPGLQRSPRRLCQVSEGNAPTASLAIHGRFNSQCHQRRAWKPILRMFYHRLRRTINPTMSLYLQAIARRYFICYDIHPDKLNWFLR
jgi:glucan 1,3-beta-glucosidase